MAKNRENFTIKILHSTTLLELQIAACNPINKIITPWLLLIYMEVHWLGLI